MDHCPVETLIKKQFKNLFFLCPSCPVVKKKFVTKIRKKGKKEVAFFFFLKSLLKIVRVFPMKKVRIHETFFIL